MFDDAGLELLEYRHVELATVSTWNVFATSSPVWRRSVMMNVPPFWTSTLTPFVGRHCSVDRREIADVQLVGAENACRRQNGYRRGSSRLVRGCAEDIDDLVVARAEFDVAEIVRG